jgi:hypothetical protein
MTHTSPSSDLSVTDPIVMEGRLSSLRRSSWRSQFNDVYSFIEGMQESVRKVRAKIDALDYHEEGAPITLKYAIDACLLVAQARTMIDTLQYEARRATEEIDRLADERYAVRERIAATLAEMRG